VRIVFKLYADLARYLPDGGNDRHAREIDVPEDATPAWVIERYGVPSELAHLVLLNGLFVPPEERERRRLAADDELAIFPPVAGG